MVKILQCCDKLVTNMTLWSQGCSELVKLLHVVTRWWQGCDKVAKSLQPCHNLVISVWVSGVDRGVGWGQKGVFAPSPPI